MTTFSHFIKPKFQSFFLIFQDNHFNTAASDFDKNQEINYRKAKMATEQGFSRIALGEINNRVSAITIDTSKGGALKKEILQPVDSILTRAKSARLKASSTAQPVLKESLTTDKYVSHKPFSNDVSIITFTLLDLILKALSCNSYNLFSLLATTNLASMSKGDSVRS